MNELDRPLVLEPQPESAPEEPTPRTRGTPVIAIAVVGLLLGGTAAWWWTRDETRASPTESGSASTEGLVTPSRESARPLPPLGQMDTFLRALLGALSSSPELARWLATDDLIGQMANGIDRISRGISPTRELQTLQPKSEFTVASRRDQLTIDPASYRRYDALASLVSSLDARAVADAYRTIHPRLDEAYRGLGRSEGGVDDAVGIALQLLIDTPVIRDPVRVVHGKGTTYAYADPQLEKLLPIQKQLLRMGPDNVERVQARLREILAAIETPPTG